MFQPQCKICLDIVKKILKNQQNDADLTYHPFKSESPAQPGCQPFVLAMRPFKVAFE